MLSGLDNRVALVTGGAGGIGRAICAALAEAGANVIVGYHRSDDAARNLAAAFAFDETRQALLIDCDATHPAQHEALNVGGERGGLIDFLENPALPLEDVVYPTGVPRLQLIPSGRIRETPGESYSSLRMRAALDALRATQPNRQILLDGSPVQGSPDARILSDLADLVVLVVGEGQVPSDAIDKAVASFPPEKIAGVVFNRRP